MTSIGETQSETFVGRDGDTFTRASSHINGAEVAWDPTFEGLGGDFFRYSYTPDTPGFYEWAGSGSISGELAINFEVEPVLETTPEGETVSETFIGATGESFTRVASFINGSSVLWDPIFEDLGDDFFRYSYTPLVAGFYEWSGNGTGSGPITINFEIEPSDLLTGIPATTPPPSGAVAGEVALDDLVEHVALRSMDLVQGSATSDAPNLTSFDDSNALIEDDNFYAGMEAHFRSGPNAGLTRRINASYYQWGRITWAQPLPFPVTTGTRVNLYNRSGLGHLYTEYKNALNMVIRELGTNAMTRVDLTLAAMPGYGAATIGLDPAQISKVCRFSYVDYDGSRANLRRNRQNGWWANNGDTSVSFHGSALGVVTQATPPLIAHGYRKAATLVNSTDTTFIDPEWLVETAAGLLQNANPDNAGNLAPGQYLRNRADAMRGKMATPFDANCVRVG